MLPRRLHVAALQEARLEWHVVPQPVQEQLNVEPHAKQKRASSALSRSRLGHRIELAFHH